MTSTKARIKPGEKVLVVGSGGGIGSIALQMAKHLGAFVIALTSTPQKIQMAKDLGADIVINYKERPDWSKEIWKITEKKGVDVVLDSTGQTVFKDCIRSLNKGGRYVTCGATSGFMGEVNLGLIFWKQLEILGSTMASDQEFKEALNLVFQGKIKPIISKTYPFEQIKQAHLYQEDSQHIGKVVVTVP